MALRYGVVALGRSTFDVPFAEEMKAAAFAALDAAGIEVVGRRELMYDAESAAAAFDDIQAAGAIDLMLILQVTFTDATMTVRLAQQSSAPIAIWAIPEPRAGGRLRLNAFCGINLASHALGKAGIAHGWLYAEPNRESVREDLIALAEPATLKSSQAKQQPAQANADAQRVMAALNGAKIGVVGKHPDGFDTCEYDPDGLASLAGVAIDNFSLDTLFNKAKSAEDTRVAAVNERVAEQLDGVQQVDPEQLDRSYRVYCGLQDLQREAGLKGLAVRCWPEMFTEYGCAACGPMAMMNQQGTPCGCEADVYGTLTALMLQELVQEPVWMADLVDIDTNDDTAVLWHCGLAPLSMCDPDFKPQATIHTNRKMPLLHQFPLKPGRITIARISQSRHSNKMVVAGAEMLKADMAFTGTSGVLRFDKPTAEVCAAIMDEGLEHHYALAYGDHRAAIKAMAAAMQIPVLEIA